MPRLHAVAIPLVVCLAACDPVPQRTAVHVNLNSDTQAAESIDVRGLGDRVLSDVEEADLEEADWASFFAVFTADTGSAGLDLPPVAGSYRVEPSAIRFSPSHPFVPGLSYRVRFDPANLRSLLDGTRGVPPAVLDTVLVGTRHGMPKSATTTITAVYPSADRLPANQLKFYIHFSAQMAEGRAYSNLRLIDEQENESVEAAFLEVEPELWDPARRRFTLLVNPGRVKRDVALNRHVGEPLAPGRTYRLEIDKGWLNANGTALENDFEKTFHALPPDRTMLNSDQWVVAAPPSGSGSPLTVKFGEPLDHALLMHVFSIYKADAGRVEGDVATSSQEREWLFTPTNTWQSGDYEIRVETILEDLAGNTLRSVFDVDLAGSEPSEIREAELVRVLPFTVADPSTQ